MSAAHQRFAEIRAAAIAAFGEPVSEAVLDDYESRVYWGIDELILSGTTFAVLFVHAQSRGAWWVVDDVTGKPTVPVSDAIKAIRPLLAR